MRFLRTLQSQQRLREVVEAFDNGGVLQRVQVDCDAGVVLGLVPFPEFDARDGAVVEEGCICGVFLDAGGGVVSVDCWGNLNYIAPGARRSSSYACEKSSSAPE